MKKNLLIFLTLLSLSSFSQTRRMGAMIWANDSNATFSSNVFQNQIVFENQTNEFYKVTGFTTLGTAFHLANRIKITNIASSTTGGSISSLYTVNGNLSENRILDLSTYNLTFENGETILKGIGSTAGTSSLNIKNSLNESALIVYDNKNVVLGDNTTTVSINPNQTSTNISLQVGGQNYQGKIRIGGQNVNSRSSHLILKNRAIEIAPNGFFAITDGNLSGDGVNRISYTNGFIFSPANSSNNYENKIFTRSNSTGHLVLETVRNFNDVIIRANKNEAIRVDGTSSFVGFGISTPSEKIHSSEKVRADTGFNYNGNNGITQILTFGGGNIGDVQTLTIEGGIITKATLVE